MSLAKDWLPSDLDRGARIAHLFRLFEELSPHVGWEVAETEDDDWQAVGLSCSPEQLAVAIRVVVAQLRKGRQVHGALSGPGPSSSWPAC